MNLDRPQWNELIVDIDIIQRITQELYKEHKDERLERILYRLDGIKQSIVKIVKENKLHGSRDK